MARFSKSFRACWKMVRQEVKKNPDGLHSLVVTFKAAWRWWLFFKVVEFWFPLFLRANKILSEDK